jgi:hypothetical protein
MMRKLRLLFILATMAIVIATAGVLLSSRADARRRAGEAQAALRKAVLFLKPDTKRDLRFGKGNSTGTPAPATPAPTSR